MKIIVGKKKFNTITIKIETPEELTMLWVALNDCRGFEDSCKNNNVDFYDLDSIKEKLWRRLDKIKKGVYNDKET